MSNASRLSSGPLDRSAGSLPGGLPGSMQAQGSGGIEVEQGGVALELSQTGKIGDFGKRSSAVDERIEALFFGAQIGLARHLAGRKARLQHQSILREGGADLPPFVEAVDSFHDDLGGGHRERDLLLALDLAVDELEESAPPVEQRIDDLDHLLLHRPEQQIG